MGRAVGIDLGTTYTAVAYIDEWGKPTIIKNIDGQPTTPSAVYIDPPHYVVGDVAMQSTLTEPERCVQFIKRFMGVKDYRVNVEGKTYSPEFISSIILRKIVQEAEAQLGESVDSAVITVPAYFTEAQRHSTLEAGQLAGLNVLRIINEPTAAALSYGIGQRASSQAAPNTAATPAPKLELVEEIRQAVPERAAPIETSPEPAVDPSVCPPGYREVNYRGRRMFMPIGGGTPIPAPAAPPKTQAATASKMSAVAPVAASVAPSNAPTAEIPCPPGYREMSYRGRRMFMPLGGGNPVPASAFAPPAALAPDPILAPVEVAAPITAPVLAAPAPSANSDKARVMLVYDLGGGTFDVTVMSMIGYELSVLSVGGDPHLGGKDWDDRIINYIEDQFRERYGTDLDPDASLEAELRLKAEAVKRQLTGRASVPITFKARVREIDPGGGCIDSLLPVRIDLSRQTFESITSDLLQQTSMLLDNVLSQAKVTWNEIDDILCVGGSSRMPMVRALLTQLSGRQPLLHDPDECVAKGAALQAALIAETNAQIEDIKVSHVLSHSLGVATTRDGRTVIDHIVPSLTPLPCSQTRDGYTTTMDNQSTAQVHIYEGESTDPNAYPNGPITTFHVDTTPLRPAGQAKIRVEFRCDENGRIMVLARDADTGKESRALVELGHLRSDDEVESEAEMLSQALVS